MPFCTRYYLVGACFSVFCTVLMVHHFILSSVDPPEESIKQNEIEERKNQPTRTFKGVDPTKETIKQNEIEEIKKNLYTKIFKEIMDKTFFDDPLKGKCESNRNLLKTKDSTECLAQNTIFFLETSNSSRLNARQACAVESAALHHPDWQIRVLSTTSDALNLTEPFMELLTLFGNARFLRMDLDSIMQGTPLWYWHKTGRWKSSPHKVVHLSDAIRLSVLWKYGGIYLDTDVVVLRSLSHLHNTVSFDSGTNLGNSFLAFNRGHSLLRFTITDYVASYNPNGFASNGPVLLNKNFREHCEPKSNNATDNKCHINVLPKESVYPIDYTKWQEYFKPQTAQLSETAFNSSYIIHVWNKMSSGGKMLVGQNSWYEMAMKRHCPKVYELVAGIGYA